LERPVKFYDPGMSGSQSDEGILLDESRLKFVVACEVALVEDFDRILVFRDPMRRLDDLQRPVSHAVWPRREGFYVLWNRTPPLKYRQS
jgi:hypothetical protein